MSAGLGVKLQCLSCAAEPYTCTYKTVLQISTRKQIAKWVTLHDRVPWLLLNLQGEESEEDRVLLLISQLWIVFLLAVGQQGKTPVASSASQPIKGEIG